MSVYEFCIHRVSSVSGRNISSSYVQEVCLNVTTTVNQTEKYFDDIMDLANLAPVDLSTYLMGYAAPVVNILTLVLNLILITTLLQRRSRSPTNIILVSIAIFDTLTGLFPLPGYLYMYTYEGHKNYPSMAWCSIINYLGNFAPKLVHTIALWLRALLAFHRYIGVAKVRFDSFFTKFKGVAVAHVGIILLSLLCHCFQLFTVLKPITVIGKQMYTEEGIQYTDTCYQEVIVIESVKRFAYVYTWVRIVFAQILPCLFLLIFNVFLIRYTYKSYTYRRRLIAGHRLSEIAEIRNAVRLSLMLILVTSFTCIFELFVDANLIINFAQISSKYEAVDSVIVGKLLVVSNFLIFLSFPLNFFFILALSNNFRSLVTSCFRPGIKGTITPHTSSKKLSTESDLKLDDMSNSASSMRYKI